MIWHRTVICHLLYDEFNFTTFSYKMVAVEIRVYLFDARLNHGLTQVARSDLFTGIGDIEYCCR
jgi:hypothetical protein